MMHIIGFLMACFIQVGHGLNMHMADCQLSHRKRLGALLAELEHCVARISNHNGRGSFIGMSNPLVALTTLVLAVNQRAGFRTLWQDTYSLGSARHSRASLATSISMSDVAMRNGAKSLNMQRRVALVASTLPAVSFLALSAEAGRPDVATPSGQPPSISLKDGSKMPAIGFGTCCRQSAKGPPLIKSAKEYLSQGGRLIDTAQLYYNHKELGIAVSESGIPREQLWITDKVNTYFGSKIKTRASSLESVSTSLQELNLEYIDLMLIHGTWSLTPAEQVEVWRGLIDAKSRGLVRSIGVSNFEQSEIENLVAATGVRPVLNQLEYHPWVSDRSRKLVSWCQQNDIAVTAYGSLGGSGNKDEGLSVVDGIAAKYGISSAQLLLHWVLEQGVAVIPGATSADHIRENLYIPSFKLSKEDLSLLQSAPRPAKFTLWENLSSERS